jgi:hypothetical protein
MPATACRYQPRDNPNARFCRQGVADGYFAYSNNRPWMALRQLISRQGSMALTGHVGAPHVWDIIKAAFDANLYSQPR